MSVELNAQTVKWFKLPDEQLDPLMCLGVPSLSEKPRFHCCSYQTVKCCLAGFFFDYVRVKVCVHVSDAAGPVLGLEMVVVMVWIGSYQDR